MPVYEFRCNRCEQRFEITLSYAQYDKAKVVCPHCNASDVSRRIRPVRIARSSGLNLENLDDANALDALEENPRDFGKLMREMSRESGEDLGPEFDHVVSRLEKGDSIDEIGENLPDLPQDGIDA